MPSGGPRWQPRLNKARMRLVKQGWLEPNAWGGEWELTERGWAKARRDRAPAERHRTEARLEAAETGMAVAT